MDSSTGITSDTQPPDPLPRDRIIRSLERTWVSLHLCVTQRLKIVC